MKTLVVGQEIFLFGTGRIVGKVVSVSPSIDVQTNEVGLLQFGENGEETEASRCQRLGLDPRTSFRFQGPGPEFCPWVIDEASDEEHAERGKLPPNVQK